MTTPDPRILLTGTTPGPWEARVLSEAQADVYDAQQMTLTGYEGDFTLSAPDARLMAAAPDLAARVIALEDEIRALVGRFEDAQRYRIQLDDRTTLNSLRALLDGDTTTPVGDTNTTPKETK